MRPSTADTLEGINSLIQAAKLRVRGYRTTRNLIAMIYLIAGKPDLLLSDAGEFGSPWSVADTAAALGVSSRTIEHLKKRFVEEGLEAALDRKPREKPPREVRFDGAFEARLIAMACSDAPEGYARWTVRLLADKAVELNFAESVSHVTVQRILKKTNLSLTSASIGKSRQKEERHL